jgi:molecular chaperone DnaK (HSP70)
VGIDLGTTHTVVAWAEPQPGAQAQIFPIAQLVTPHEAERRPLLDSVLHAPLAHEALSDPWGESPWVVGALARSRGAEVPGRLVSSAKSWLCHGGVDRLAAILPWGGADDDPGLPRLSPVQASTRVLEHVRRVWDQQFPDQPLAEQEVVLTVPASFDEVARELTVRAAEAAGLRVRLLEEPQAAFYDWMQQAGEQGMQKLLERSGAEALVLVCDVGGGTTDLSLIRVARGTEQPFAVTRVAVGQHLLLGGDNMDLALAHAVEARMLQPPARLDPARFGQLVLACRRAKELLLSGDDAPEAVPIALAGAGSKLVGSTLSARIERSEAQQLVLEGFFPSAPRDARPRRMRSALVGFGLPYEQDAAITRHVAWFFARHSEALSSPHALLLNGGVFRARSIGERLAEAVGAWGPQPVGILPHSDPDLAVARGAVAFGLALRGLGRRIDAGAARGYYVGLGAQAKGSSTAVCVVPRGAPEGSTHSAAGRTFALVVGRPARFELFASDDASHAAGEVVPLDEDHFQQLPPVTTTLGARGLPPGTRQELHVGIEGELTAIGTLELACVAQEGGERFRLAFQLREGTEGESRPESVRPSMPAPPASRHDPTRGKNFAQAAEAIERVFGKGRQDVAPREVKDLVRELERLLGERQGWTLQLTRALFDVLWAGRAARRRSADHERHFWLLSGYCVRPGFGEPHDQARVEGLFGLFDDGLAFPAENKGWRHFWITWRRVAAGLQEQQQAHLREALDPLVAPASLKLKKPKRYRAECPDELLELLASLERVPPQRKAQLGGWILERTWTDRDPRLWAALGRIGARVPAYASVHHVLATRTAETWVDHLLREKWEALPTAAQAAVQLSRVTGDRARDLSESVRSDVEKRLVRVGARDEWIRAVRELVQLEEADRAAFYGEELPVGLRLVG